jgi:hypothetical protein
MKVIRCAKLDFPVDLPSLRKEIAALPDLWIPHFQKMHYEGGWTVFRSAQSGVTQRKRCRSLLAADPQNMQQHRRWRFAPLSRFFLRRSCAR